MQKDSLVEDIAVSIREEFLSGLEVDDHPEKYLQHRAKEIEQALTEVPRRLSVAYTNLGVIYRYREDYKKAAELYQKALSLWEDNLDAENNLNHLLGQPIRKRNFFQKMFPGERL